MPAGPLLYRPPPRWQFWAALSGAVLLHVSAVAIAAIKHEAPVVDLSDIPTATVEAQLQPEDQPTPPPEDIPIPEPPPVTSATCPSSQPIARSSSRALTAPDLAGVRDETIAYRI